MWLLLFISILAHADKSCVDSINNVKCDVACKSRDYDGGKSIRKDVCQCYHLRDLNQLIDHNIYLSNTRLKEESDFSY